MQRRSFLQLAACAGLLPQMAMANAPLSVIEVFKSASCGCCTQWAAHLQKHGFVVHARNVPNTAAYRSRFGIPASLGSCHTATIAGYALEGHVPAAEIRRLVKEKPAATGLAVPQMPMGSPGMEGMGAEAFDVLLLHKDGRHSIYQHYAAK